MATPRPMWRRRRHRPWALPHGEFHELMVMRVSTDGKLLYEGNSGGRVYVWAMGV